MWAEMSHRYAVLLLTIFIILVLMVLWLNKCHVKPLQWFFAILLLLLLIYQPLLGMWTVTLQLHPSIVSQHLLSGLSLMVLIGVQWLYFSNYYSQPVSIKRRSFFGVGGLVILILCYGQLFLGAWTSTNYAALSCDSFPFCHIDPWLYQFKEAFNLWRPLGDNYSGGVISEDARRTIQVVHRLGALIVGVCISVWIGMLVSVVRSLRLLLWCYFVVFLLLLQVIWGLFVVYFSHPLTIALLHTLTAGALLMSIVTLNYQLWCVNKGGYPRVE
jgi:cytochrome c oxidase assembly protein subunit 15